MTFEWDKKKNKLNQKKHGISFEQAIRIFNDQKRIEHTDFKHTTFEEEHITIIGSVGNFLILFIVMTGRNGKTRFISAREAEKSEKKEYYDNYDFR